MIKKELVTREDNNYFAGMWNLKESTKRNFAGIVTDRKMINSRGNVEGIRVRYDDAGNPFSISYYKDGELHGTVTELFENGKVKSVQEFEYGERHGNYYKFNRSGNIRYYKSYVHDICIGVFYYDENEDIYDYSL